MINDPMRQIAFFTLLQQMFLRWLRTVHVWLHYKNLNTYSSKSTVNSLLKGIIIYKVFVYLSYPANQNFQLLIKGELEI